MKPKLAIAGIRTQSDRLEGLNDNHSATVGQVQGQGLSLIWYCSLAMHTVSMQIANAAEDMNNKLW